MMFIHKRSRLLATWILTAALACALAARPTIAGEPDSGGSTMPPTQQQQAGATLPWAMRIQAALQALLSSLPQTLP